MKVYVPKLKNSSPLLSLSTQMTKEHHEIPRARRDISPGMCQGPWVQQEFSSVQVNRKLNVIEICSTSRVFVLGTKHEIGRHIALVVMQPNPAKSIFHAVLEDVRWLTRVHVHLAIRLVQKSNVL